jgi:DNA replication initiation complex subunit (GINS family)
MQLEIDCYEWVLGKIDVNKIPFDRLERIIKATIKDLEKRKDNAMVRTDTDDLWTKIESLQWVLFAIFAIRNYKMVVV